MQEYYEYSGEYYLDTTQLGTLAAFMLNIQEFMLYPQKVVVMGCPKCLQSKKYIHIRHVQFTQNSCKLRKTPFYKIAKTGLI